MAYYLMINESFCFSSSSNNNNNKLNLMRLDQDPSYKSLPNSPIIYLKLKQSSQQMASTNNQDRFLSVNKNEIKTGKTRKNSNIFQLPLKFISNGRPSKIIPGKYCNLN